MTGAFFTICAKNYLPVARACLRSIASFHPSSRIFLFLCDAVDQGYDPKFEEFEVLPISQIDIPELEDLKMRYDVMELNTAVKPWCFMHLFNLGYETAIYMDPDTWVISEMKEVCTILGRQADAVVTPHVLQPVTDGGLPDEFSMLRVGVFNLGFLALARRADSIAFLQWWGERLRLQCGVDLDAGLFTDQRWCDLLPCFIGATTILRHPGYNVAYWNLMQREVECGGGEWRASGEPLRFAHFSGASFNNDDIFSKHQTRFTTKNLQGMAPLYARYRSAVREARMSSDAQLSYSWNMTPDGELLSRALRRFYAKRLAPGGFAAARLKEPTPLSAARAAAAAPAEGYRDLAGLPLTRLMVEVWDRPDLRAAFDIASVGGRAGYIRWFLTNGVLEDPGLKAHADSVVRASGPGLKTRIARRRGRITLAETFLRWAPLARGLYSRLPERVRFAARDRLFEFSGRRLKLAKGQALAEAPPPTDLVEGALLIGYVRGELGMGEHVRMTASALEAVKAPFGMFNYNVGVVASQGDYRFDGHLTRKAGYRANIFHINADQLTQTYQALGSAALSGRVNIGYPAWELDVWPEEWIAPIRCLDEVWAPSKFIQTAISRSVDVPVVWMPLAVKLAPGYEAFTRNSFNLPIGNFLFLFTFDFSSYVDRKNPEGVVAAFKQAFPAAGGEGPILVIKTISGSKHPDALNRLRVLASREDIKIIEGTLDANAVHGLINVCDCYVSLHRSEGFGRGLAEAMMMAKPVISTAYSGNLDFTTQETARLVGYELKPVGDGQYPYSRGAKWAEPSLEDAAQAMRELAADPEAGRALGGRARAFMVAHHSAEVIGARYEEGLRRLGCLGARESRAWKSKLRG